MNKSFDSVLLPNPDLVSIPATTCHAPTANVLGVILLSLLIGGKMFLYIGHLMNDIWFIYISPLSIREREAPKMGILRKSMKNTLRN